jgi:hypothetical protein
MIIFKFLPKANQIVNRCFSINKSTKIDLDERIGMAWCITHDCLLCVNRGSEYRLLPWIINSCAISGEAVFPCDSYGKSLIFPSEVFREGLIESLLDTDGSGRKDWFNSSNSKLREKTPNEVFVPNWLEKFYSANGGFAGKKHKILYKSSESRKGQKNKKWWQFWK